MADQPPGDTTPAAGMPGDTRFAGSAEPPTTVVPGRWSGAAVVPRSAPRRSLWSRMVDRINGTEPAADPADDRTAVPAVDPWADQDTPAWPDPWTTPAATTPFPETLRDVPAPASPPTRFDAPASPAARSDAPAPAPAGGSGPAALIPPRVRAWSRQAAADAPGKLRSWGRRAAARTPALNRQQAGSRQPAGTAVRERPWVRPHIERQAGPSRIPVQARPPAPAQPRRRRRLRRLTRLVVVGLVLFAAYWLVPGARQYPVTAVLPSSFADLDLRDTAAGRRAAQNLAEQLQQAGADGDTFAGIYADSRGKRVTVFGVTGLRLTPDSDVQAQLDRLTDALKLKDIQAYDLSEFGAHQRCGTGRLDGAAVVACTWADHGSLATVLLTRRSQAESADLVTRLRTAVLQPA